MKVLQIKTIALSFFILFSTLGTTVAWSGPEGATPPTNKSGAIVPVAEKGFVTLVKRNKEGREIDRVKLPLLNRDAVLIEGHAITYNGHSWLANEYGGVKYPLVMNLDQLRQDLNRKARFIPIVGGIGYLLFYDKKNLQLQRLPMPGDFRRKQVADFSLDDSLQLTLIVGDTEAFVSKDVDTEDGFEMDVVDDEDEGHNFELRTEVVSSVSVEADIAAKAEAAAQRFTNRDLSKMSVPELIETLKDYGIKLQKSDASIASKLVSESARVLGPQQAHAKGTNVYSPDENFRLTLMPQMLQALARRNLGNAVLVAPPGTGKTWALEQFVKELYLGAPLEDKDAESLASEFRQYNMIRLDPRAIDTGSGLRGDSEAVIDAAIKFGQTGRVLFLIDSLHSLDGVGSAEGNSGGIIDTIYEPISRGEFRFIGASSTQKWEGFVGKPKHAELVSRTTEIPLPELKLDAVVSGVNHFTKAHQLPALSPRTIELLWLEVKKLNPANPNLRTVIDMVDRHYAKSRVSITAMTDDHARAMLRETYQLPEWYFASSKEKLAWLEKVRARLDAEFVGQDEAKSEVIDAVKMMLFGVSTGNAYGGLLFTGMEGEGKTAMLKLTSRLLGLGEAQTIGMGGIASVEELFVRLYKASRLPFRLMILDELEKTHPKIIDALYEALGESTFTAFIDGEPRVGSLQNTFAGATANAAREQIRQAQAGGMGFVQNQSDTNAAAIREQLKAEIPAPLLRRFSKILFIQRANSAQRKEIFAIHFAQKLKEPMGHVKKKFEIIMTPEHQEQFIAWVNEHFLSKGAASASDVRNLAVKMAGEVQMQILTLPEVDDVAAGQVELVFEGGKIKVRFISACAADLLN